ncbi:MAG: patatin-like phospholipase family protein [Burkholderiales bacterium]|nr:patatin-like phospholipase family protein [Burkholderiales bacterium]
MTVSLVLGGGGARGLAHIGAIEWLNANGYRIRSISGSSIGALVGGIYAAGKLDAYADWSRRLERHNVVGLLDPALGRAGLFKGDRIIGVLRALVGEFAIDALPLAFTAVATDLHTGEEVWLREGPLFDAIRASIAIPLVFTPFELGGRTLLDGALVNPLPIAPTLDDGTDLTVAVDLSGPPETPPPRPAATAAAEPAGYARRIRGFVGSLSLPRLGEGLSPGMLDIAFVSMQAMQDTITRLRLSSYAPDVTVSIPRNACGYYEFWRADEMIEIGRQRTASAFARFDASAPERAVAPGGAAADDSTTRPRPTRGERGPG